jgi:hypothetical protein
MNFCGMSLHLGLYIFTSRFYASHYLGQMDLQEVGRGCGDWMELAQNRGRWRALVSAVMNFQVP